MYHKVTPYFPMKQVFGSPKTKSLCEDLLLASKSDELLLPTQPFRVLIPGLDSHIEVLLCPQFRPISSFLPMKL